jgi:ABC-2 type transport system permease protein
VVYDFLANGALPQLSTILVYAFSVLLSSLILFYINYLFGLAAFFVEYVFGFIFAKEAVLRLLSGQLIPLAFFPAGMLAVFKFLPFAGLVYTPTMLYLGKYTADEALLNIAVQAVWVVLLMALTQFVWHKAIKRLTIMGG